MVTRSRKRRWSREEITRSSQVSVAETPRPIAAAITRVSFPSTAPLPSSASHSAIRASGTAASSDSTNAVTSSRGSWW